MTANTVAEVVTEQLSKWEVERVYGYAGDTILNFFSALRDSPIELYTPKHESAAGLMASAEAKLTGDLAVCTAHSGPGTANIINGIADASSDKAPVLLITGQVETWNVGTDYKQYVKQQELTNPLTTYSSVVMDPESVVDILVKAMSQAITKGGVSHVVIPYNLWEAKTGAVPRDYPLHLEQMPSPREELLDQAADEINKAEKPIILYGRGARGCREELLQLAEQTGAGLINTLPATGIISGEESLTLGGLGATGNDQASKLFKEADLIIMLGATWWPMDYVPREPKVIQVDAVKGNIGKTFPVQLGIVGDLKEVLAQLVENISPSGQEEWREQLETKHQEWLDTRDQKIEPTDGTLAPQTAMNIISDQLSEEEIVTLDSGDNVVWFGSYFNDQCSEVLVSGSWRTMGFGLPAALAAKLNRPDEPVTCITGDGGIEMVMGELLTGARYELPVRIIIFNNEQLAMERNKMESADLPPTGVDLTNPDFVKLAESCQIKGMRVESPKELEERLAATEDLEEPIAIEVPVTPSFPEGTKL